MGRSRRYSEARVRETGWWRFMNKFQRSISSLTVQRLSGRRGKRVRSLIFDTIDRHGNVGNWKVSVETYFFNERAPRRAGFIRCASSWSNHVRRICGKRFAVEAQDPLYLFPPPPPPTPTPSLLPPPPFFFFFFFLSFIPFFFFFCSICVFNWIRGVRDRVRWFAFFSRGCEHVRFAVVVRQPLLVISEQEGVWGFGRSFCYPAGKGPSV